jgi:hypothetical protein
MLTDFLLGEHQKPVSHIWLPITGIADYWSEMYTHSRMDSV